MARIHTSRPEAAPYNGATVAFVRVVGPADGPAFNDATPQMIVRYEGNELYFYADEVSLSDEDQDAVRKSLDEAHEAYEKAQEAGRRNAENKKKLLEESGDQVGVKPERDGDGIAAHAGLSAAEIEAGRNPQNRVPSTPPPASNIAPAGSPQEDPGEKSRTPPDQLPGGTVRENADEHPTPDNPKAAPPAQGKGKGKGKGK